jgi:2-methylcitrate dehydratase PrpD
MANNDSLTGRLIEFIHRNQFEDLPAQVVHDTKRLIADTIGCALGAANYDAAKAVSRVAAELGGPGEGGGASVLGTALRVSPAAAVSANMYLGNYLDADDTYLNFSHPAVGPVFAALAFCESLSLSGRDFIAAVALGYEVGCRAGMALELARREPSGAVAAKPGNFGWYGFAVAGAAGKALGLDRHQFNNAFGLAGWTAPILTGQFFAPGNRPGKHMVKYTPVGCIGMNGVMAAQLARNGFVAEQNIFDAPEAFWEAFGAFGLNRERLLAGLGQVWQVSETSLKPYAACRYGHPGVNLFNRLVKRHGLRLDEIESVTVRSFGRAIDMLKLADAPQTPSDLQFSIPWQIAAAAHGSELGASWQLAQNMTDPRLFAFARKVRVEELPEAGPVVFEQMMTLGHFRRIPNEVQISARGQVFSDRADYVWGDPWSAETRMTDAELQHKFRGFAAEALPAAQAETALDALFSLEQVDNVATGIAPLLRKKARRKG